MGFARRARAALHSKAGKRAIGLVRKGVKVANPRVHAKLQSLGKRAKFYLKEGKDIAKNVAEGTAAAGAAYATGGLAAVPAGAIAAKKAVDVGKGIKRLLPAIKKDARAVRRDTKAAKAFVKRKGAEIKHSISNPGGGAKPRISSDALARMVKSGSAS
jgi:hypothetical protein